MIVLLDIAFVSVARFTTNRPQIPNYYLVLLEVLHEGNLFHCQFVAFACEPIAVDLFVLHDPLPAFACEPIAVFVLHDPLPAVALS